jgi:putative membrane protein
VTGSKKFLTDEQIKKITSAVIKAEQNTSGEIVPMIVGRSSTIGHLPTYIAFVLFSIFLVTLIEWPPQWMDRWFGLPLIGIFILCWVIGLLLSQVTFVQRWLIPNNDEETQVWNRARSEWAFNHMQKTQLRTGILLFVSVMERKAVILADEGIAKHYPESTWKEVINLLSAHLKKGEWVDGFEKSIQRCGEILSAHLPASASNVNEISDRIIIKD